MAIGVIWGPVVRRRRGRFGTLRNGETIRYLLHHDYFYRSIMPLVARPSEAQVVRVTAVARIHPEPGFRSFIYNDLSRQNGERR
jgi:hypothetical protein